MSADALEGRREPVTYALATWGVRAVAYLIDQLIVSAVIGVAFGIAFAFEPDTDDPRRLLEEVLVTVGLPIGLLYAPLLLVRGGERNGQTLGKQAMRIRVVRENGEPVTLSNALLRETLGRQLIAAFTYGFYLLIDYAWPLWDRARQCLHDKVAQTRVVRTAPVAAQADGTWTVDPPQELFPRSEAGWAPSSQAAPEPLDEPPVHAPAPAQPMRDDRPVRDGWLPPRADS